VISAEAFVAAAEFVETYAAPMLGRVYGDANLPEADRNAARIARYIVKERPTTINLRDVRRQGKVPGLRDAAKMREAMKVLEEAAWCFHLGERAGSTPGRAREDYAVNPQLWAALA
jgi:hypothetical protein